MVGGTPAAEFESDLAELLAVCRGDKAHPRTVVMMELPVMFGMWRFGVIQRRLARRYQVVLIPKRVLCGDHLVERKRRVRQPTPLPAGTGQVRRSGAPVAWDHSVGALVLRDARPSRTPEPERSALGRRSTITASLPPRITDFMRLAAG